jgi:hypothetical protein
VLDGLLNEDQLMAEPVVKIEVKGIDVLERKLKLFPARIQANMSQAAEEAGKLVVWSEGLATYPPETAANHPPTPYYKRGAGMVYKDRVDDSSEKYGSRFTVQREGFGARIGNSASYAKYLAGDQQSKAMAKIGWRKLIDVANEKIVKIKKIFDGWVAKTIRDLNL